MRHFPFAPAGPRPATLAAGVLAFVLAAFVGSAVRLAAAQQDAGGLRVLVVDSSGAVVAGATLELTNAATNTAMTAVSDDAGYTTFSPLLRGTYAIKVSVAGFKTVDVRDLIIVDVNERKFLRLELEVAAAAETVQVLATRTTLQTEEGSIGQVIQGEVAVELPLAARRYTELALLVPGTTNSTMTLETRGPGGSSSTGTTTHRTISFWTASTTTRARRMRSRSRRK